MLTSDRLDLLFRCGQYGDVLKVAHENGGAVSLESHDKVLVAHAFAMCGSTSQAEKLLIALGSLPLKVRARAEQVLGVCSQSRGDVSAAIHHFGSAMRLASECKDKERRAWAHLALLRLHVYTESAESIAAMLRDVRRSVTEAGDPQVATYLHACVAVVEGQAGRLSEAWRHCEIADSILASSPNAWLSASILQNRMCIATFQGDFKLALALLGSGRQAAETCGDVRLTASLASNAAHIQMFTGDFEAARRSFSKILQTGQMWPLARLGAVDGLAQLELAAGALDACQCALAEIDAQVQADPRLAANYYVRWSRLRHARLLLRRGNPLEALVYSRQAKEECRSVCDPLLGVELNLVIAEASSALGEYKEAATQILSAYDEILSDYKDSLAQTYSCLAAILGRSGQKGLGIQVRDRANRVAARHGIVLPEVELTHVPTDTTCSVKANLAACRVGNALAAAFTLARSPRLLGMELVEAVSSLGCTASRIVVFSGNRASDSGTDELSVFLGEENKKRVYFVSRIPEDPGAAMLLSDVIRIGQAALALEKYRNEERGRAAVWPADPIETEAGALFLDNEMQALLGTARKIAPTNVPVLITGETGTGKEVLAKLIHAYSNRARATFLPFNCSASPKDMLDAQLFGHRRGAFTGAVDSFQGVIRGAAGGTLFLDEIGETTLDVQPKLLRFLESSEVHPIGEMQPVRVDVRVIAATNADIDSLVSQGRFREDLFYRLNIVRLHVPPLRERRVEIPALANHYLAKAAQENAKGDLRLAEETMEYLVLYRWPGNVRQLANEMRRMAALAEAGAVLMPEHLSTEIAASRKTIPASERVLEQTEIVVRLDQPMAAAVQHVEQAQIQWAMQKSGGGLEETAALLGISRKGLYLKRQRFGIDPPEAAPEFEVA